MFTESEWVPVSPKKDNSLALVPLPPSEPKSSIPKTQNVETQKAKVEPPRQSVEVRFFYSFFFRFARARTENMLTSVLLFSGVGISTADGYENVTR